MRPLHLAIAVVAITLISLPACEGPYYRSFSDAGQVRDRTLVRQARLVADSSDTLERQIAASVTNLSSKTSQNITTDPALAYEQELHRCEARVKIAADRLATLEFGGQTAFERWELELGEYKDNALRDASKKALEEIRPRHKITVDQLKRSNERLKPFLLLLSDQSRLLRHASGPFCGCRFRKLDGSTARTRYSIASRCDRVPLFRRLPNRATPCKRLPTSNCPQLH